MISLHRDTLTFTFPEIAGELRALVEQKIQQTARQLPPLRERDGLRSRIESHRYFRTLDAGQQEAVRSKIATRTSAHVQAYLREFAFNRGGVASEPFASLTIKFERTMRLPDDGCTYALPTGLGQVPLRSVDDFPDTAPASWIKNGGVVLPLDRSEALWVWFSSRYRFAIKIKIGEVDALSGTTWSPGLQRQPQNYLVAPAAPWEDNSEVVRRAIALHPDTSAASTTAGEHKNAVQLEITPIRPQSVYRDENAFLLPPTIEEFFMRIIFAPTIVRQFEEIDRRYARREAQDALDESAEPALATARQKVTSDPYQLEEWDQAKTVRCILHVCGKQAWRRVTRTNPPYPALTATEYLNARIPWVHEYAGETKLFLESTSETADPVVQQPKTRQHTEVRAFRTD